MRQDERYHHILEAALRLAQSKGSYRALTRGNVAEAAGVSSGLINHYYLLIELLRLEVLTLGIQRGDLQLLAEGLVAGEPVAQRAPLEMRARAAVALLGGEA